MSEQRAMTGVPTITLGWRLRMALEHADIKVADMASELGVTRGTISRWGHDDGAPPRDAYLRLIAIRCGVPFEWIKNGVGASDTGPDQGDPMSTCTAHVLPFQTRQARRPAPAKAA